MPRYGFATASWMRGAARTIKWFRLRVAEGNRSGRTSHKSELHLTNVARASLEELLLDFEDYLRQRRLPQWTTDTPEVDVIRAVRWNKVPGNPSDPTDPNTPGDYARQELYTEWLECDDAVIMANCLLCLIHQANYLLDQQITAMEQGFIEGGGYTEQLAAARIERRSRRDPLDPSDRSDPTDPKLPDCPQCGRLMSVRTARQGKNKGQPFLGCTGYPECKGTLPLEDRGRSD